MNDRLITFTDSTLLASLIKAVTVGTQRAAIFIFTDEGLSDTPFEVSIEQAAQVIAYWRAWLLTGAVSVPE